MTAWLSIIGVGDHGLFPMDAHAQQYFDAASLLIGGDRHLAMLPEKDSRPRLSWPSPLMTLVEDVLARRGEKICILASGDPMHYGIGVTFAKRLPAEELAIFPAPSAFSLAAARLGWDLARCDCLTLHGRPLELLVPYLYPGAQLLALSDSGATPAEVARLLVSMGFGDSRMTVLEHMGGAGENRLEGTARTWTEQYVRDLNTVAIHVLANPGSVVMSRLPGLPDDAFRHDGQITKSEIRAATLSALAPRPGQLLWDVGAGSGAVAIEWLRCHPRMTAIAIEAEKARCELITHNSRQLGTPLLQIRQGTAPDILAGLPDPDAVFIGGGFSRDGVFEICWDRLHPGGILVANSVTAEGEVRAFTLAEAYGGQLTRLAISRAEKMGRFTGWKPFRQITQLRLVKR